MGGVKKMEARSEAMTGVGGGERDTETCERRAKRRHETKRWA